MQAEFLFCIASTMLSVLFSQIGSISMLSTYLHLSQAFLFAPYYYDWRQERLDFHKPLCISMLGKGMPRFLIGKSSINRFLFFLPLLLWSLAKSFLKPPISCVNTPLMQKRTSTPKKVLVFSDIHLSLIIEYGISGFTPFRLHPKGSRYGPHRRC